MFNVTILKMKDIIKYFIGISIVTIIVIFISKNLNKNKTGVEIMQKLDAKVQALSKESFVECLDQTIPTISNLNEEYKNISKEDDPKENNLFQEILGTQISSINGIEKMEAQSKKESKTQEEIANTTPSKEDTANQTNRTNNDQIEGSLPTQVITNNPIKESYNVTYGNVKIKNQTTYQLTNEMLTPDITIENKNIILFHTHSCESYTPSEAYNYTQTGNFRTTDLNFTVTRVGTELETELKKYNYNVVHNMDYHDYPSYNGSYTNSLKTVENILQTTSADIIIDLHRDAIGSRSDYAPIVKIGENDIAAQLMFVIGTNQGGLWHPNWNQNLKFAIKIQEKAEEMYPRII